MEEALQILDLSNKKLKKLNKPTPEESQVLTLILDNNELTRLDNIDSFTKVEKLSAVHNQLLRMYGVCRLHLLQSLNLSCNGILTIEGLKELVNLKWLCLAGNSLKTIEHLQTNTNLEYLDLSENNITHIADLSFLKCLKELYLHKNKINHLDQCDKFLPISLTILTLAYNNIGDLNEISRLANLVNLTKISIANNPCINFTGGNVGFDYRPFVINWCLNVSVIDDYMVDAIENLRAEWLYSQGRGRHFRVGDQRELAQYLAAVCPLTGETLETEDDRKLRVILSKAQHHQQQLRNQSSSNATPVPSPISKKKITGIRPTSKAAKNKLKSPDRMSSSCYGSLSDHSNSSVMVQSLDPMILRQTFSPKTPVEFSVPEKCLDYELVNSPLQALSKNVPVPESLMSPDYHPSTALCKRIPTSTASPIHTPRPSTVGSNATKSQKPTRLGSAKLRTRGTKPVDVRKSACSSPVPPRNIKNSNKKYSLMGNGSVSSEEESEMCDSKLHTIQMKAKERSSLKEANNEIKAAVCIQRHWRGYYTRNKDRAVQQLFQHLQSQRANQYIQKLATDMETTKAALESERKIQMLQTEAINALYKKISDIRPDGENAVNNTGTNEDVIKELAQTRAVLQTQIQELQHSMQDVMKVMSVFGQSAGLYNPFKDGIATQTEIVAVHTPQGEAAKTFPFLKLANQPRPSSLPLPVHQRKKDQLDQDLDQFAITLVDGAMKNASESSIGDNPEANSNKGTPDN
ncbi:unnamed protein product [Phyllotreta striolata]|uniref:Centrosomal protein of 97 kDa n=1 Tax=Phyllotreta striolata TaxID=444603 RepID=A0A9N9TR79_PHYSR|nr:unnamed protein product [Phyllotreta striolata]